MKYVIIGGVAGGATTAARLRRLDEKSQIILFEKGSHVSYANCGLPYYIGGVISEREKLFVQTAQGFSRRFNVEARVFSEVVAIDSVAKSIQVVNLTTGERYTEIYDKLVLSPGAEPVRPNLPGFLHPKVFTLRNVSDTDRIKNYINDHQVKKALVVGAGFIGLEMAENLHHLGVQVSIVEMTPQVMAPLDFSMAAIVHQQLRAKKVNLLLNQGVTSFVDKDGALEATLSGGEKLVVDMAILSIGVRPDVNLAKMANLELGVTGGIKVNEFLQTSSPDIYAVGDAIEFPSPITHKPVITYLAGPANRQGRICADNIVQGNHTVYKGSIATAVAKVFDLTVAATGMPAKLLKREGIAYLESTTHSASHATYYPGATMMSIKIVFSPTDGKVLGGQVVGNDGVDKRADLIASVIKNNGTIYNLIDLEHAYAPPYSSAKDPVNMAGYVAENILLAKVTPFYWDDVADLSDNAFLLDVRTKGEFEQGTITGAVNIPVDDIRSRLSEIPVDKDLYVFCQVGLRGYIATKILMQLLPNKVLNLSGGYRTWSACFSS